MSDLTVADILDKAADHIEKYGWIQGDFGDDHTRPKECAVCARGGISVATGHNPMFTEDPTEYANEPLVIHGGERAYWEELDAVDQASLDLIRDAECALAARVTAEPTVSANDAADAVAVWNDADDRTAEQVVAELRACAADLRKGAA